MLLRAGEKTYIWFILVAIGISKSSKHISCVQWSTDQFRAGVSSGLPLGMLLGRDLVSTGLCRRTRQPLQGLLTGMNCPATSKRAVRS